MAHDVFVSYAHIDDVAPLGDSPGWVSCLVQALTVRLTQKLGRPADVFQDVQLVAPDNVPRALYDKLAQSRTLIVVMSAGYRHSVWCGRELGKFVERSRADNGVFLIETEPLDRASLHPALQGLKGIKFWRPGEQGRGPRQLGYPVPDLKTDPAYWTAVCDLAHFIGARLARPQPDEPSRRSKVVVAESTDDLLDERQEVVSFLRQLGCDVLPSTEYPRENEGAFTGGLLADLKRVAVFVQLLSPFEGRRAPGSMKSFVALQADLADQHERSGHLKVIRWRKPVPEDSSMSREYRAVLFGDGVRTGTLATLKKAIEPHLDRASPGPPESGPAKNGQITKVEGGSFVVVKADEADTALAIEIADALGKQNFDATLASSATPSDEPQKTRQHNESLLTRCDGLVLVYGRAPRSWVQAEFALARKVLASRGVRFECALLDGPPPQKEPAGLRSPFLISLDCRAGFVPAVLTPFVEAVRLGSANA